ncbi:MAG: hypothetical protein ACK55I_00455, partial [bacterium]
GRRRRRRARTLGIGLVEAAALVGHAHGLEHLLHGTHGAVGRVLSLGQGVVGESLLNLNGFTGLDELVDVGRHNEAKGYRPTAT